MNEQYIRGVGGEAKVTQKEEPTTDKQQQQTEANRAEQHQQQQGEAVQAPPRRRMEQIGTFSDQIWLDTLAWLGREEVGWNFALVNARFAALVDTQLQQRRWCLEELHISKRKSRGSGAEVMVLNSEGAFFSLPLAITPMPDSIVGFNGTFNIWYLDSQVINFLLRSRRLFTTNISLQFNHLITEFRAWQAMARHIWPLLRRGVRTLVNLKRKQLALLRKHVSPTVLFDCPNLVEILTPVLPERLSADNTNDASADTTSARDLYMWLHMPSPDGRPKVFKLIKWNKGWDEFVNQLFSSFTAASVPVNYMVLTSTEFNYTRCEQMFNFRTAEKLTLMSTLQANRVGGVVSFVKILRCPAEFNEADVVSWFRVSRVNSERPPNWVTIGFSDDEIGPLPR
ncbi:hypothetical protein niasHS_001005 [Heterodera schachtii]|uniref:F-box domain-containing protein n=1 Tax=Heterodera schachtii TaxID=97005 RepID=A0ABD2K7Y4_HETSC